MTAYSSVASLPLRSPVFKALGCGPCEKPDGCRVSMPGENTWLIRLETRGRARDRFYAASVNAIASFGNVNSRSEFAMLWSLALSSIAFCNLRVKQFNTIGANAVAKFCVGVASYVRFNLYPITLVITYVLAGRTNRQKTL